MRQYSLSLRLLALVSLAVALFLGLTGISLDRAFRDSARTALTDRLQGQVYALLASADLDLYDQMEMPMALVDERYASPASGLYAAVLGPDIDWHSPSALGLHIPWPADIQPGEQRFLGPAMTEDGEVYLMGLGVAWELPDGSQRTYAFAAAEQAAAYHAQIAQFRTSLWGWLVGAAVLLLLVQLLLLRWGLRPLRQLASELGQIEAGEREALAEDYPRELAGVSHGLNALISSERRSLQRYRHSLGDLAHSLKTPLTVIRSGVEALPESKTRDELLEQAQRMDELVAYQLKRAAAAGSRTLGPPLKIEQPVDALLAALRKVHGERGIRFNARIHPAARFRGEKGDLLELLGNLLDNAGKWASREVQVSAQPLGEADARKAGLQLQVEDDGPGIPDDQREHLLRRGVRGDQRVSGHGIGLAIVADLVAAHDGEIEIGSSTLGGASIVVRLPPA